MSQTLALVPFVKVCSCGRTYDEAEWSSLPLCVKDGRGSIAYPWGEVIEFRNCACGTTLLRTLVEGEED